MFNQFNARKIRDEYNVSWAFCCVCERERGARAPVLVRESVGGVG